MFVPFSIRNTMGKILSWRGMSIMPLGVKLNCKLFAQNREHERMANTLVNQDQSFC